MRGFIPPRRFFALRLSGAGLLLALSACAPATSPEPPASYAPAAGQSDHPPAAPAAKKPARDFSDLPGWREDEVEEAFAAWQRSCGLIMKKSDASVVGKGALAAPAQHWKPSCREAMQLRADKKGREEVRAYFERRFLPVAAEEDAFLTGYFAPEIKGSRKKTARAAVPIYARPPEMKDGAPFLTRQEIERGALKGRGLEVAWAEDPADVYFLQVQGSGTLVTETGERVPLAFAGKNGQPYVALGKLLIESGDIPRERMSMQAIKAWMHDNPKKAEALRQKNPSFVFFKRAGNKEVYGASGAVLTAGRSLAVDPAHIPYGLPVFVETKLPGGGAFRQLMVAQDTGSAIRGKARGDIYFGAGDEALKHAGEMHSGGRFTFLLPHEVAQHAGI